MPDFTKISFDLVHEIRSCKNINNIHEILDKSSAIFGYDTFVIADAPDKSRDSLHEQLTLARWPVEWADRYARSGYMYHDPVVAHTRRTNGPFRWNEAPVRRDERLARLIMGEAAEIGLRDGLCIPIHDISSTRIVSFGGSKLDLPDDASAGLHLIGIYADLTAQSMAPSSIKQRQIISGTPCSPREIECIKWASAGKTGWETSEILSLSYRTVEDYLNTAARKLGASNRVHLIAKALRQGIID